MKFKPFLISFIFRKPKFSHSWVLLGVFTPLQLPRPLARCQLLEARSESGRRLALGLMLRRVFSFISTALTSNKEADSCVTCVIRNYKTVPT